MYQRTIESNVKDDLFKGKIIIIYGPRQVGKTTMVRRILDGMEEKSLYIDCQESTSHDFLVPDAARFKERIGNAAVVALDEAQYVPEIGRVLKVFHDAYPDVQLLVTGSSSFDLANRTSESLAGRTREYTLFPLSVGEIIEAKGRFAFDSTLESLLRFGSYPAILDEGQDAMRQNLETLQSAVLYKDILALDGVNKPRLLTNLLKALALQIGSEVSNGSLANLLDTSVQTVDRYVDILEKMFVVKRLYSLSRNPRVEIRKGYKVYFLDLGIRNSIIQNHNPLDLRTDKGALFENFFVIERLKYLRNNGLGANTYFWRTNDQKEIDYVEERDGTLAGFECSFAGKSIATANRKFQGLYENATEVQVVTEKNIVSFVT